MNRTFPRAARAAVLAGVLAGVLTGSGSHSPAPGPGPARTTPLAAPVAAVVPGTVLSPLELPAPPTVGRPTRLLIPAIGVDEALHGVGLKPDGAMETPDFGSAGWYEPGPRPGAAGPAVLVAHVHGPAGDDVFARLHELGPGDRVTVRRTDGVATFVVDRTEQVPKESLPHDRIWNDTDQSVLRLITCGGTPDPVTRMYPDNTLVYAHLVG